MYVTRNSCFSTLTYARNRNIRNTWLSVNTDTNRYVQRVRRKVDACEYLKTYETHADKYPHCHVLFLFSNLSYHSNNSRWLPDNVFAKLKSAWTVGLSDHQSPNACTDYHALKYILKYVAKSSSSNHLWKLLLSDTRTDYIPPLNENGYPIRLPAYASYQTVFVPKARLLFRTDIRLKRIKLISWSRGFITAYRNTLKSNEPCPKRR